MICSKCGHVLADDSAFCDNCGSVVPAQPRQDLQQNIAAQMQAQNNAYQANAMHNLETPAFTGPGTRTAAAKKPINKNLLIIGAAAAAAVVVLVIILIVVLSGNGGGASKYLYVKDGEVYLSDNGAKGWEVTSSYGSYGGCVLSKDGSKILYSDRGAYYVRGTFEDSEPVKVASNINIYPHFDDGNTVVYQNDDSLYRYIVNREEKIKVASDVNRVYEVSDDCRKFLYETKDNGLYVVTDNSDNKEKIDSDVSDVHYNDDFTAFHYIKDGNIYFKRIGGEREKLVSEVSSIVTVNYSTNNFYYTKRDDSDSLLYYYCNGESNKVTSNSCEVRDNMKNGDVVIISEYDGTDTEYKLVRNGNAEKIDLGDNIYTIELSEDGKTLYYVSRDDDEHVYDLYKMNVSGGATDGELVDDELSDYTFRITEDGHIVYIKDYNNSSYDLYADGVLIDSDVSGNVLYQDGIFYYLTDMSSGKGTLNSNTINGKAKKIKDDVSDFHITSNGVVLFLYDVSSSGKGEFHYSNGGDSVKIDDDVTSILASNVRYETIYFRY